MSESEKSVPAPLASVAPADRERLESLADQAQQGAEFIEITADDLAWLVRRSGTQRRALLLAAEDAQKRGAAHRKSVLAELDPEDADQLPAPTLNVLRNLVREMCQACRGR